MAAGTVLRLFPRVGGRRNLFDRPPVDVHDVLNAAAVGSLAGQARDVVAAGREFAAARHELPQPLRQPLIVRVQAERARRAPDRFTNGAPIASPLKSDLRTSAGEHQRRNALTGSAELLGIRMRMHLDGRLAPLMRQRLMPCRRPRHRRSAMSTPYLDEKAIARARSSGRYAPVFRTRTSRPPPRAPPRVLRNDSSETMPTRECRSNSLNAPCSRAWITTGPRASAG
jgi:hypothetical protein